MRVAQGVRFPLASPRRQHSRRRGEGQPPRAAVAPLPCTAGEGLGAGGRYGAALMVGVLGVGGAATPSGMLASLKAVSVTTC